MLDEYQKRVFQHREQVDETLPRLMEMAQRLSPDFWVLQYFSNLGATNPRERFTVYVTNGDDNVMGQGRTLGGAVAHLIGHLLDGAVYPLTGNGGRYVRVEDRPYYEERERKREAELRVQIASELEKELEAKVRVQVMDELRARLGWVNDALITAR